MTISTPGAEGQDAGLDLLHEASKEAGSVPEVSSLTSHITCMTEQIIQASAVSLLLVDKEEQQLVFELAEGAVGRSLEYTRMSTQRGIAGWVARYGKPLIVNDVSGDPRFNSGVDDTTGFVTKSIMCAPLIIHGQVIGVIEVLNKLGGGDFEEQDLEALASVAVAAAVAIENAGLPQAVADGYRRTVAALAAAIDAKDPYTRGHAHRVVEYALMAGRSLLLLPDEMEALGYAAMLHDIGKLGVPDSMLRKPGGLNAEEWVSMHRHPSIGSDIASAVPFLRRAGDLIRRHHERHDGMGYEDGLSGNEIPIGARIIAVAEAFDTMTSNRAYRSALTVGCALEELRRCVGSQFCPIAVDAFMSGFQRRGRVLAKTPS